MNHVLRKAKNAGLGQDASPRGDPDPFMAADWNPAASGQTPLRSLAAGGIDATNPEAMADFGLTQQVVS
jgi:hypothetical protein